MFILKVLSGDSMTESKLAPEATDKFALGLQPPPQEAEEELEPLVSIMLNSRVRHCRA